MRKAQVAAVVLSTLLLTLPGCAESGSKFATVINQLGGTGIAPSQTEILEGLREALAQGSSAAVNQLGRTDGFWQDTRVRVPLPGFIARYENAIRSMGYGGTIDQFQLTLNRAAEQAVPKAATIFADSIRQMSAGDARDILNGPSDAATQFFRRSASQQLFESIRPIVVDATSQVGVTQQYKKLTGKVGPILRLSGGSTPTDLDDYVTQKTLDGIFLKIVDEEARIRADPAARSTELLKKVFASK